MVTAYQRRMDAAVVAARLYDVPVECVMHRDMLHNWRRRTKRLERARVAAYLGSRTFHRRPAIAAALNRLYTGRPTP